MLTSPRRNPTRNHGRAEESLLVTSLRPENYLPGLIIGFLLGLFVDFSGASFRNPKCKTEAFPAKLNHSILNDGGSAGDNELLMVLVVRQNLRMGAGKIASQCAHAATGMYAELLQSHRSLLRQWEQCGQPKIVVTCKNQQEMNRLKDTAEEYGLPTFIVVDAGRTQVHAGSKTVLAIGPEIVMRWSNTHRLHTIYYMPWAITRINTDPTWCREETCDGFCYWQITTLVTRGLVVVEDSLIRYIKSLKNHLVLLTSFRVLHYKSSKIKKFPHLKVILF